jgi:very-short-patch-repair endonuclease
VVAQALDRAGVLFLPNCRARLNLNDKRTNREADFLVCHHGKWGILEVDGEPFHPPSRTVQDHERDRLFQKHGIKTIEHYDATRCYNAPSDVVAEFLQLLSNA